MIGQFVSDVVWGELDYLLIDTPPGTSDEHLSIVTNLKSYAIDGAVLVTTPQVCTRIMTHKRLTQKDGKLGDAHINLCSPRRK